MWAGVRVLMLVLGCAPVAAQERPTEQGPPRGDMAQAKPPDYDFHDEAHAIPPDYYFGEDTRMAHGLSADEMLSPVMPLPPAQRAARKKAMTLRRRAIVQLYHRDRLWCTATLVAERSGERALLLAGHCLLDAGRRRSLTLKPGGRPLADAWVDPTLTRCQIDGLPLDECFLNGSARDLALIPVGKELDDIEPWDVCTTPARGETRVAYGYGEDADGHTGPLGKGLFPVAGEGTEEQYSLADQTFVRGGDSGGPALSLKADNALPEAIPEVCWIISGHLPPSPGTRGRAPELTRFESAWKLPAFRDLR